MFVLYGFEALASRPVFLAMALLLSWNLTTVRSISSLTDTTFPLLLMLHLPRAIRRIVVSSTFKRRLKVELFSRAYDVSLDITDE